MIKSNSVRLCDGLFKQNIVFMSGLFAAPIIGGATSLESSLAISFIFTIVTLTSVGLCRPLPRKLAFSIRVVLYALISAIIYIPVWILSKQLFGETLLNSIALYLMIIITNPLIMSKTESRFFLRPVMMMFKDLLGFVLGFDLACIIVGALRDILTDNMIAGFIVLIPFQIPSMDRVYCGFIIVGILAGLFRYTYTKIKNKNSP